MFDVRRSRFVIPRLLVPVLLTLTAVLAPFGAAAASPHTWTATGRMSHARSGHTATLLANGKVLVAGGYDTTALASAELYDPVRGTWAATGTMSHARAYHRATLLANGTVLVVGGYDTNNNALASAEVYSP